VASFGHLIPNSILESLPLCVYEMRFSVP
jgi:hypothetical protein